MMKEITEDVLNEMRLAVPTIKRGTFKARAVGGKYGDDDKDRGTASVEFELLVGPNAGAHITYNGLIDMKSAPYIARDLKAVGWQGRDLATLASDITTNKAEPQIELIYKLTKDNSRAFTVVRSIGRGAKPLKAPSKSSLADANAAMREALASEPTDERPDDDRIPF